MLTLRSVLVENFRCIERAELTLSEGLTFVVGANAAGKSALLDAIALVADLVADPATTFTGDQRGSIGAGPVPFEELVRAGSGAGAFSITLRFGDHDRLFTYALRISAGPPNPRIDREALVLQRGDAESVLVAQDETGARALRLERGVSTLAPEGASATSLLARCEDARLYPELTEPLRWLRGIWFLRLTPVLMRRRDWALNGRPDRYGRDLHARLHAFVASQPRRVESLLTEAMTSFVGWVDLSVDVRRGTPTSGFRESAGGSLIQLTQASDGSVVALYLALLALDDDGPSPTLVLLDEIGTHTLPGAIQVVTDLVRALSTRTQVIGITHSELVLDELAELEDVWAMERRGGESPRLRRVAELPDIGEAAAELGLGRATFNLLSPFNLTPPG